MSVFQIDTDFFYKREFSYYPPLAKGTACFQALIDLLIPPKYEDKFTKMYNLRRVYEQVHVYSTYKFLGKARVLIKSTLKILTPISIQSQTYLKVNAYLRIRMIR